MWIRHFVAAMAFTALGAGGAGAAPILLFEQDFESPSGILVGNAYCTDISQQLVNTLFGTAFQQVFTVETIAIHGPSGLYSDPGGEGGNTGSAGSGILDDDVAGLRDCGDWAVGSAPLIVGGC